MSSSSSSPERRNSDVESDGESWRTVKTLPAIYTRFVGFAGDEEKALLGLDLSRPRPQLSRSASFIQVARKRNRYVSLLLLIGLISTSTLLVNTKHGETARRAIMAPIDRIKLAALRPAGPCDPFSTPGTLVTETGSDGNVTTYWKALDEQTCPTSRLSGDLKGALQSGMHTQQLQAEFPWMVNRTIVKVGDSIDRSHVVDFCNQIGGELTVLGSNHPSAVPDKLNGRDERVFANDEHSTSDAARPHVCRIEKLNFELINFYIFGLASFREFEEESFVFKTPHYHAPAEFGDRIKHTVVETLRKRHRGADVVEFNSVLWDARHLIEQDGRLVHESQKQQPASLAQLAWYRVRLSMAIGHLQYMFPSSQILWRRPHAVRCNERRATCTRSVQLGQVADSLLSDRPDIRIDNYGALLEGQTPFYADNVTPGPRFAALWSDVILFELRRAVAMASPKA